MPHDSLRLLRSLPAVSLSTLLILCAGTGSAQTSPPADSAARATAVVLTPFEVLADKKDSYEATNTASLTGINTSLQRVPITADIYNRALLDDLGVTDLNRFLGDFAGYGSPVTGLNQFGRGNGDGDVTSADGLRARGLTVGSRRNGFTGAGVAAADSFSVERVEVIRGPQSLLYGPGDPGGVINYVSKAAVFGSNRGTLKGVFSSEGTYRAETDFNVARGDFAVRVGALNEAVGFYRANLERDQQGIFTAVGGRFANRVTLRATYTRVRRDEIVASSNLGPLLTIPASFPDPTRNGQYTTLLLAQGRTGDVLDGRLNWSNVDSLFGDIAFRLPRWTNYDASAEVKLTEWLSFQARYAKETVTNTTGTQTSLQNLRPGVSNPTGQWAIGYEPSRFLNANDAEGTRFMMVARFPATRFLRNNLTVGADFRSTSGEGTPQRFFLTDATGKIAVNPATVTNATAGRTTLPPQWVPLGGAWDGPFSNGVTSITLPTGATYVLGSEKLERAIAPAVGNPLGLNGGIGGASRATTRENSVQAAMVTDWFDGRFDSLLGLRQDVYRRSRYYQADRQRYVGNAKNLGVVWHFRKDASLYYGYSDSNRVPGNVNPSLYREPMPLSLGKAHEFGLKFSLLEDRLSGSISRYSSDQKNDNGSLPFRDTIDPLGLNGQFGPPSASIVYDRTSKGYEVTLTAKPIKNWNVRFSYSNADGIEGTTIDMLRLYNDEFNTTTLNGQTVVAVDRGGGVKEPLLVNSTRGDASTPLVPLTVMMMRDSTSSYFATLDPNTGRITNTATIGLTTPGVASGRVGLPISAHQLGYLPPGGNSIRVKEGGERTQGYAVNVYNLTNSYRITTGWARGVGMGMNLSYQRQFRSYYYTDVADGSRRKLFSAPDVLNDNVWLSYDRKITKRIGWRTQLNVANVGDRREVLIMTSAGNGLPQTGRYVYAPRLFTWTNTISF